MDTDLLDRAIVARIPTLIKARPAEASGRRIVTVEASTEEKDLDRDIVMQSSLLNSAASFIATGHLDLDHKSEIGHRMRPPITDPLSYVVGRPLDVKGMPGGRTFVEGEISKAIDGSHDPRRSRADEFWDSLLRDPPVLWYASIYGFPTDLDDCTRGFCPGLTDTRFVVKAIDWRSLAFTRTPKNTALKSETRIVSAKAYIAEMVKAEYPEQSVLAIPQTMDDVYAASECQKCGVHHMPSLLGYRAHFAKCAGYAPGMADIAAHATMHKRNMEKALARMLVASR